MGRHVSAEYSVKNTFVDLQIPAEEQQFVRSQRSVSDTAAGEYDMEVPLDKSRLEEYLAARTPSPMMHPAVDPTDANQLMMQMPMPECGYELGAPMSIAFGDLPPDFELSGFDGGDGQGNFVGGMTYDPSTGMYVPYDWGMQNMQYGYDGYQVMNGVPMEGGMDEFGNCITMMPMGGTHTENLLAALSQKIEQGRDQQGLSPDCIDGGVILPDGYGMPDAMDCMDGSVDNYGVNTELAEGDWSSDNYQVQQPRSEGGRKSRNRERGERGGRGDRGQEEMIVKNGNGYGDSEAQQQQGPVNFTTVMFRNIPNKYTREMLVKQLEQELKGHFDFVYLPIDFKNQCNVGYAFINFRSVEACEIFLQNFNGVEVRKCLPGLNSRKVTEVTPARVQGFEDNVQRLRNSPVMRELAHHPEWMPLIFDENGVQLIFPNPERPLEPIKPRRRAREEVVAGAGA